MMRVVLLTAAGPWSGAEVHTVQLASALRARGHDVVIVELGRKVYANVSRSLPCQVLYLDRGLGLPGEFPIESLGLGSWLRLFKSIQSDVAILVKGNFKFGSLALDVAARCRFRRYLTIEHMHAPLPKRIVGRHFGGLVPGLGLWWVRSKILGYLRSVCPHKIICVSHAVASTLHKDYGYPLSKLGVAHSGVDTNRFAPNIELRSLARKAWGIPEMAFVFGTLGRLSPMKNHYQLINAFAKLSDSIGGRDIRLVIVGDGPQRSSLEMLAHSTGVGEQVIFGGYSDTPEKIYPAFDVFCFPSTTGEALPLALIEAMSCGCPPIAASVGGVPEILNDSLSGWLICSGDQKDLFSAMQLAVSLDEKSIKRLSTNARERVLSHFNATVCWENWADVVEAATAGKRKSGNSGS